MGIRKISTPWPIVVGKAAFSVTMYWIGTKDSGSSLPESVSFGAKYILNVVQSVGAVCFLIDYLAHGGTFPSIGIMLSFENFITLKYPLKAEERTIAGYKVRHRRENIGTITFKAAMRR